MKIILIGAQFSGKGTLAKKIARDFGFKHISPGDLFRENIKNGTEIGLLAKSYMDKGVLVPLEVTVEVIKNKLQSEECAGGFILDGFPRSKEQALALQEISDIDNVILLDVPLDEIKRRCLSRRVCPNCGEIYSTTTYSKPDCDKCNTPLIQRDDDNWESIKTRLEVYERETTPLINFYADRLFVVKGQDDPDATYEPVKNFLKGKLK